MSTETIIAPNLCFNCAGPNTFKVENYAGEKGNTIYFCSNKCRRQTERADKIPRPKLDPSSVHQYTIMTGNDNTNVPRHTDRSLQLLSKAILKTSKKPVKGIYLRNEGPLPKEWR